MFTPLRGPSHPTPPLSTEAQTQSLPFKCPKCGVQLHIHNSRLEPDANGRLERVHVYLCFQDGLYTFRDSRGFVAGL